MGDAGTTVVPPPRRRPLRFRLLGLAAVAVSGTAVAAAGPAVVVERLGSR